MIALGEARVALHALLGVGLGQFPLTQRAVRSTSVGVVHVVLRIQTDSLDSAMQSIMRVQASERPNAQQSCLRKRALHLAVELNGLVKVLQVELVITEAAEHQSNHNDQQNVLIHTASRFNAGSAQQQQQQRPTSSVLRPVPAGCSWSSVVMALGPRFVSQQLRFTLLDINRSAVPRATPGYGADPGAWCFGARPPSSDCTWRRHDTERT